MLWHSNAELSKCLFKLIRTETTAMNNDITMREIAIIVSAACLFSNEAIATLEKQFRSFIRNLQPNTTKQEVHEIFTWCLQYTLETTAVLQDVSKFYL